MLNQIKQDLESTFPLFVVTFCCDDMVLAKSDFATIVVRLLDDDTFTINVGFGNTVKPFASFTGCKRSDKVVSIAHNLLRTFFDAFV